MNLIKEESCHVCKKIFEAGTLLWQEVGQYNICAKCHSKVRLRQAESAAERTKKLNFDSNFVLDRDEILFLRDSKILSKRGYIYLALRSDYDDPEATVSLNIVDFCDRWQITQYDLMQAMAILGKKGVVQVRAGSLQIRVLGKANIINGFEKMIE